MKSSALLSILALISAISAAVWFGLSIAAQSIAYDLFIGGTSDLRSMELSLQLNTIRLVTNLLVMAASAYAVLIVSVKLYLWLQRSSFKRNGYLMMCMALYIVSVPFGLYYSWLALKLYWLVGDHYSVAGISASTVLPAFTTLFTKQEWMNFLSLASFVAITSILIFKPLQRKD